MRDQARATALLGDDGELLSILLCVYCGTSNRADHHFCKECGRQLGAQASDLSSRLARISDYTGDARQSAAQRNPLHFFLIALAVFVLVAILVAVIVAFSHAGPLV
jgi:uncharacterized membrane protein YvbJ